MTIPCANVVPKSRDNDDYNFPHVPRKNIVPPPRALSTKQSAKDEKSTKCYNGILKVGTLRGGCDVWMGWIREKKMRLQNID